MNQTLRATPTLEGNHEFHDMKYFETTETMLSFSGTLLPKSTQTEILHYEIQ